MKILMISRRYPPHPARGSAFTLQRLAESLSRRGIEVVVINTPDIQEATTRWHNGVKVYDIPVPNDQVIENLQNRGGSKAQAIAKRMVDRRDEVINKLINIVRRESPTLVHTMTTSFPPGLLWQKVKDLGLPVVHTLQLHSLLCKKEQMFLKGRRCDAPCSEECRAEIEASRVSTQWVDAVVGCSQFMTDIHVERGLFEKATIKTAVFNSSPENPLPKRVRRATEPLQIGFLGQISADKGPGWLAQQLRKLPNDGWQLWVAGRGSPRNENAIKKRLSGLPANFMGYQDAQKFLTHIDLLVIPSMWEEPFGLIAAESLAAGTPILTSRRGGLTEIANASGDVAELFEPGNPRSFLKILRTHINNPAPLRDPAVHALCRKAAERFSVANMTDGYLTVYEGLL